jgi:hypothetical protein
MRWLLWLKTRHRTRLAVQQQRFEPDGNADYKISQGASAPLHRFAAPYTHIEKLKKDYFDDRNS